MTYSMNTLEFDKVKNLILKYSYSNEAKLLINNLKPTNEKEEVINSLNQTNEILNLINKYGIIPFINDFDNNIFKNKFILRTYNLDEFLNIKRFLNMNLEIINYYKSFKEEFSLKYTKHFFDLYFNKSLFNKLNTTINDYGEVYDNASSNLLKIRKKIKSLTSNLNLKMNDLLNKHKNILNDSIITIKNNRPCLSVNEGNKNQIKGVIHDISKSKQTVFIEPDISLKINAEIEIEKALEKQEITKILEDLTNNFNEYFNDFKNNLNLLINLDLINSKANYSLSIDGNLPNINNKGIINLINAKHPLLNKDIVVPISLKVDNNNHTLLITGPNTGGKTVSLKTVGLLTLMAQSGILIPVDIKSDIAVFDNVFVDIGDEQSIETSLSTFSSHMSKIISFLNNLTNNSLVLLDELGSGTDPNEGVSLAIAIIEEFQKKNIRLIVTSHFSELKTYSYEKEGIILASVDFDLETLKPLYKLKHGIVGESHARVIAKNLGMKDNVINKANELFLKRETELSKVINKLNKEKEQIELLKEKTNLEKENYINKFNELNKLKEQLLKEQNDHLLKIRKKEEENWNKKIKEVNELISKIESKQKDHDIAKLKGLVRTPIINETIDTNIKEIKVGNQVFIKPYKQYGKVISINNDKYLVKFGNFELSFKINDLKLVEEIKEDKKTKRKRKKQPVKHDYDTSSKLNVDLRGFRYNEVKEELDNAIDKALLSNINTLTIIHGFGTFTVRKAVEEYIRKSNLIKSHRLGGEGEGLSGVTIITLK